MSLGTRLYVCCMLAMLAFAVWGCQQPSAAPTPSPVQPTAAPTAMPTPRPKVESRPIQGGPVLLRDDIALRKVVQVGGGNVALARNPRDGQLYYLNPADGVFQVALGPSASTTKVVPKKDISADGVPAGMTFGPDGALYVVANRKVDRTHTQAVIRKGDGDSAGHYTWSTLASTEPYPLANNNFDHLYNGIVLSPDGQSVFVNAGSRTDHGEVESSGGAFPDTRDVSLTAAIFRIPAAAHDIVLPNGEDGLKPYLFVRGTRNAYSLQFAPNGDFFATDNGPDADYPDELNWIRQGLHYGFPWRFGTQANPQQFPDYDSSQDVRLPPDFVAVKIGAYHNDPDFPKAPAVTFADPVVNLGPDATQYRGDDGRQHDAAAEGKPLYTFTPHRSPLGLVFATSAQLPVDLRGDGDALSAFVLSWGAAGGTLSDKGQDLLHLKLTKRADNYEAVTTQIVREFKNPIGAVLIENRLYVLEYGEGGAIWELTFG